MLSTPYHGIKTGNVYIVENIKVCKKIGKAKKSMLELYDFVTFSIQNL